MSFVSVPPRFLAWQMNCFDRPPSQLHILRPRGGEELVLDETQLRMIVNEKHPNSGFISTHFAAISRNYKTLRYLIQLGAKVDALDQVGQTPLMKALRFKPLNKDAQRKQMKCIKTLLDAGTDVDHKDKYKLTAVDHATRNGIDFFHTLLDKKIEEESHRFSDPPPDTDFEEVPMPSTKVEIEEQMQNLKLEENDPYRDAGETPVPSTNYSYKYEGNTFDPYEEIVKNEDTSFEEVDIEEFEKRQSRSISANTEKTDSSWVKADADWNSKDVQNQAAQLVEAMKNSEEIEQVLPGLSSYLHMSYNGTPLGFQVLQSPIALRYEYLTTLIDHGFDVNFLDCEKRHIVEYFLEELEFGTQEDLEFMQLIAEDTRIEWKKKVSGGENLYEKLWKTPGQKAYLLRDDLNAQLRNLQINGNLPFKERPIPAMSLTKGIHEQIFKKNHEAVTSILIEKPSVMDTRNWKNYATPLHLAAELRLDDTVRHMLSPSILQFGKVTINAKDCFGCTPIMRLFVTTPAHALRNVDNNIAIVNSKLTASILELCKMMIDVEGIDVNIQDLDKCTVLHYFIACFVDCLALSWFQLFKESLRIVEAFMEAGADVHIMNNFGQTPLSIAKTAPNPNKNLIRILESYGTSNYKGSPWSTPHSSPQKKTGW